LETCSIEEPATALQLGKRLRSGLKIKIPAGKDWMVTMMGLLVSL
jgi:hypothetical protein